MNVLIPVDFIDVSRMAAALVLKHSVHFSDDTRRQTFPGSPHHDTRTIILRGPKGGATPENWYADVEHENSELLSDWHSARHVLEAIASSHLGRAGHAAVFGKVMVVSLRAAGHIDWHVDQGAYTEKHDRFHVCLVPSGMAFLFFGAAAANLPVGQLTWVNNRILHSAINMGLTDRVHLIVDIRKPETLQ